MKITCHHPASSHGIPVILNDDGEPLDYAPGLTAILRELDWSRAQLAEFWGLAPRSVEKYWQGAVPPAAKLNMLAVELERITPAE